MPGKYRTNCILDNRIEVEVKQIDSSPGNPTKECVAPLQIEQSTTPHSPRIGALWIVAAAVLWSTSGLFAHAPQFSTWPENDRGGIIAFWRSVFALVALVPLVRRCSFAPRMIPMAIAFAMMNWTYLTALTTGPPANAIWLQNLAPVWVMLASVVFLGERIIRRDWLMLIPCGLGLCVMLSGELDFAGLNVSNARPTMLAIVSGLCFAFVILSLRSLRDHDSAWLICLNHACNAVAMAGFALQPTFIPQGGQWWPLIMIGVFQMGLSYWFFSKGLKSTPSHIASLISLLEPILLPVWLFLAWRHLPNYEPVKLSTHIGSILILIGLVSRFTPFKSRARR